MAKKTENVEDKAKTKIQLALEKLDKAYGKGTVLTLDSKPYGDYDVISTGSIGFDWITLGVGGMVKGRLYELMGWEGTGKSTVCGHLVANCQAKGGVALYIDAENAVDKLYFQQLGIDTKTMLFAQPSSGEEGFQIAEEMIKSGEIDLVIIDSDSAMIPKAAIVDGDVGDSTIGKKARLNNNAYPRLKSLLSNHHVCVVIISQYREKIGIMFGNPTTTQGGHALKFYSDCRIEISKTIAKDGDQAYGNITKLKATKYKLSPPYRLSQFEIVYGKGIDIYKELIELGIEFGVIKKSGSWYSYGDTKLGQGMDGVIPLMRDNPELFDEIKALIIGKIKNTDNLPVDMTTEDPLEKS